MGEVPQMESGDPISPNSGKRTRGVLIGAIHIEHAASEGTSLRVAVGEFDPAVKRAFMDDCVWIQDENIFSLRLANTSIVPFRKTQIHSILNDTDRRKTLLNKLHRAIGGVIVGNNHFEINRMCSLIERTQTIADHLAVIPADNDDRQFQHFSISLTEVFSRPSFYSVNRFFPKHLGRFPDPCASGLASPVS